MRAIHFLQGLTLTLALLASPWAISKANVPETDEEISLDPTGVLSETPSEAKERQRREKRNRKAYYGILNLEPTIFEEERWSASINLGQVRSEHEIETAFSTSATYLVKEKSNQPSFSVSRRVADLPIRIKATLGKFDSSTSLRVGFSQDKSSDRYLEIKPTPYVSLLASYYGAWGILSWELGLGLTMNKMNFSVPDYESKGYIRGLGTGFAGLGFKVFQDEDGAAYLVLSYQILTKSSETMDFTSKATPVVVEKVKHQSRKTRILSLGLEYKINF